jgi:asparagine synthase (glutamine-hydrolysing)
MSDHLSIPMVRSLMGSFYFNMEKLAITRRKARLSKYIDPDLLEAYDRNVAKDIYAPKNVYDKQQDELMKYALPRLLRFADRNSMAFSIEQRVPHLAQPIIEFALSLPLEWRVKNGWSKYIVRKSMEGMVPDKILWDTVKRGFDIPQTYWIDQIAGNLTGWIGALPDNSPVKKDNLVKALKGPERGSHYLWNVISLALFIHFSKVKV